MDAKHQTAEPSERPPTILVVEDESAIRLTTSEYLRSCGFNTREAEDAFDAMAILETGEPGIDLVFSDINMPGEMDGLELARLIKSHWPGLPVILTSGGVKSVWPLAPYIEDNRFIRKPYMAKQVALAIRATLAVKPR